MDNKIFSVNGKSFYQFKTTLQLLLMDEYDNEDQSNRFGVIGSGIRGYKIDKKKGIILYWHLSDGVENVNNLLTLKTSKNIDKSLRKYKLDLLNDEIKSRITMPLDLLTYVLWELLQNFDDDEIEHSEWEKNFEDVDISFDKGFKIYTEDWGHIKVTSHTIDHYTKGAIKPVWCWYGK